MHRYDRLIPITYYSLRLWGGLPRQLPVTESVVLSPMGMPIMKISEKYRLKALACERLGRDVPNRDFKNAWADRD
jgi:hypothetical protein